MGSLTTLPTDVLWRHALAVIPLALFVALLVRCLPCRPATRHMLWLVVLLWLIVAPLLPEAPSLPMPQRRSNAPGFLMNCEKHTS